MIASSPKLLGLLLLLSFAAGAGCSGSDAVDNQYANMKAAQEEAQQKLIAAGASLDEKKYPQGHAWSVDLSGKQISDETFETLKQLGPITELHLSGTNLADAHAAKINDVEIGSLLLVLDVSRTEFSDAGLAQITGAKFMRQLNVAESKVTESGVAKFKQTHRSTKVVR